MPIPSALFRRHRRPGSLLLLPAAALLSLASCSHPPQKPSDNGSEEEAVSETTTAAAQTESAALQGRDVETIAILGTNDIHGALGPQELKTREPEGVAPTPYKAGGVGWLSSYANILRYEFGRSMLWLDAGDEFQGSIESNLDQGSPMVDVFNTSGVTAATIGNHEFDFGPDKQACHESPVELNARVAGNAARPGSPSCEDRLGALKARIAQARYPYISANILDRATNQLATNLLPGMVPNRIFDTGRVKVGVLGLATEDTPRTTSSVNIRKLAFGHLKKATIREAEALRAKGADLVVVTAHAGLKCERGRASAMSHLRKPTDAQGDCGPKDEIVRLLKALPPGTVDAVVAGHSHQIVHHWVGGVPVIQAGAYGRYFNVIYLRYDVKARKLLTDLTRIEGPVPVCPAVFQNQGDCNGDRPAPRAGRGPLVAPRFHGKQVAEDPAISHLLQPVFARSAEAKKEVIAQAARPIEHDRFKESPLGDIVADAMREASGAQVALMNSGGIRAPWEAGPITFADVFRTLPFDNLIVKVKLTGRELKQILRLAESGSRGFFSVSGVKLRILHAQVDAPADDLDGDGKIDGWEVNRLRSVTLDNGEEIRDNQTYTLATLDFLLTGGDDLGWAMQKIPQSRQDPPTLLLRDAVIQRLRRLAAEGPINAPDHPVIDAFHPRMTFEKPATRGKGKGSGKRKSRRRRRR